MPIDAPIHTNEGNLSRVLGAGLPITLVFWQRNCPPCEQLSPALDRLARAYAGRALVVKVNVAEEQGLARRYNVGALPTLIFFKDGREVATAIGAASEHELQAWLDHLTGSASRPPVPSGPSMALVVPSSSGPAQPARASAGTTTDGGSAPNQPVTLTDANFDRTIRSSQVPVLVDFWAVWCGPCKMVAPVVEQLAQEYAGRLLVGKLNVDENQVIAARYGIMSIPTLLVFRNGQIADRIVGALPAPALRQRVVKQVQ